MNYVCCHCLAGEIITGAEYVTTDMAKDAGDPSLAGTLFNVTKAVCPCCKGKPENCLNCRYEFYEKDTESF